MALTSNKKVLLIGWDAADWKVINPLLDEGRMPYLENMIDQGVMGDLGTLSPSLSPMLWTSIATGKRPFKHGVLGFTEPDPHGPGVRPVSNYSRKARAIWNILQLNGLKSNIVGWWPSHPAEPISGIMVSNHYHRATAPLDKPWPMAPGMVHPQRLSRPLADLRYHPGELVNEQIAHFVPDFAKIDQDKGHRLESVAKTVAEATTIQAAATFLLQNEPWDFMAVYFDAIDHLCHGFMQYHPPQMKQVTDTDFQLFNGVVNAAYQFHDMILGVLLSMAGEDTTVLLISDHGFHSDHLRPAHIPAEPAGPAVQHRNQGIFVMKGPDIKKDELIHGATILDITPTILHLFNLPVGKDMDGIPLVNAFKNPGSVTTIDSWEDPAGEDGSHGPDVAVDPRHTREALNQLAALGYIEQPDEDSEAETAKTIREMDYNLARSYMDADRHFEAIPLLEELMQNWPEDSRFGMELFNCYKLLNRLTEAERVLDEVFKQKEKTAAKARKELEKWQKAHPDAIPEDLTEKQRYELWRLKSRAGVNQFTVNYVKADLCLAKEQPQKAMDFLMEAEKIDPYRPALQLQKGMVFLQQKKWEKALACFRRVLTLEPHNVRAHLEMARVYYRIGQKNEMVVKEALEAVSLSFYNPVAHFLLGGGLHRLGRLDPAIDALKLAVAQNPNFTRAWSRLANLYENDLKDPKAAQECREKAEQARQRIQKLKSGPVKATRMPLLKTNPGTSDQMESPLAPKPAIKLTTPLADTIVVVSGLPRSGTSMMMQMLDAGGLKPLSDNERSADRHNPKGYFEDSRVKTLRHNNSWMGEARGKAVKIIAQLLPYLPMDENLNYAVILVERDLDEVIASQKDLIKNRPSAGSKMPEDLLKRTFYIQLKRTEEILRARKIPTLSIQYPDVLENPLQCAAQINEFLNSRLDEIAMAGSVDPNLRRHKSLA